MSTRVVINVYGGVVQDVFCSDPDAQVTLVDWDFEGNEGIGGGVVQIRDRLGRACLAGVSEFQAMPMDRVGGTQVEKAITESLRAV